MIVGLSQFCSQLGGQKKLPGLFVFLRRIQRVDLADGLGDAKLSHTTKNLGGDIRAARTVADIF
jgi:hypothetical protein